MRKFLAAMLMIVAFALCAVAQDKTVLKFLYYIDATQAGYAEDKAIWDKFKADNPDVDLQMEILFNDPFHQKVSAYIASGQLPDIIFMWPSGRSTELHAKKLMKDLKPLLGADYLKDFAPTAIDPSNQESKILAELPQSVTYTTVLYANKALIESLGMKLPKTYADIKAMAPKLKAKGIATILMSDKDGWPMQSCVFSTISGRMVGDGFIDQVKSGKAKFTDKNFVNALAFVDTMVKDGVMSKDMMQLGYGDTPALFAAGKAAFLIDGDWRVGNFLTDKASNVALIAPAKQKSDFELIQFPAIPGEKNPGIVSAIVGVGLGISNSVPAGSAKEKAAVKLLKYFYSADVQKVKLETGAYIPSRKNVTSEKIEPFTTKQAQYYASIGKTSYVLDGVLDASVCTVLNTGLQEIVLGTKTPQKVAEELQAAMDTWIKANKK
jgi:raffinose/stachyose/melibiose transport system substrate-binding protein